MLVAKSPIPLRVLYAITHAQPGLRFFDKKPFGYCVYFTIDGRFRPSRCTVNVEFITHSFLVTKAPCVLEPPFLRSFENETRYELRL